MLHFHLGEKGSRLRFCWRSTLTIPIVWMVSHLNRMLHNYIIVYNMVLNTFDFLSHAHCHTCMATYFMFIVLLHFNVNFSCRFVFLYKWPCEGFGYAWYVTFSLFIFFHYSSLLFSFPVPSLSSSFSSVVCFLILQEMLKRMTPYLVLCHDCLR